MGRYTSFQKTRSISILNYQQKTVLSLSKITMSYYVTTQGRGGIRLFLVDRTKTKRHWWTTSLVTAMAFYKESAAQIQANKLHYKTPVVVNSNVAKILERENEEKEILNEVHPFSSEALGQWDD